MHRVLIVTGSDSDLPVVSDACLVLDDFKVGYDVRVLSAHRAPEEVAELARGARAQGYGVVIAAAGLAAHLPGVVAAHTTLPVIGVPIKSGALAGADALYSIVQMPPGVPVACVAIDGARNAALLAVQILSLSAQNLATALLEFKQTMKAGVLAKDERVRKEGVRAYLGSKK